MKFFPLLLALISAWVTPAIAQTYWSNQNSAGLTDDIWCVTYANGTFAAVTNQGNLLTSADGSIWSKQTIATGTWLVSLVFGDGKWVAVGNGGTILTSPDLKTWAPSVSPTTNKLNGVFYGDGIFVAVGDSATIITSPDGLNWTLQSAPAGVTGFLHGIGLQSGGFFSNGTPNDTFLISGASSGNGTGPIDTGIILVMQSTPISGTNYSVTEGDNGDDLIAGGNVKNVTKIGNLEGVLYVPGLVSSFTTVAIGWDGTIISTQDSIGSGSDNWKGGVQPSSATVQSSFPNVVFRGLAYGNGYWVTAGTGGNIMSSADGINWTQRFSGDSPTSVSTATFLSATYSEPLQRFVVTGTGGAVLVSNATPTVFANVSTRGYVSNAQTFIGGFYVSGSSARGVLIRADGPVLGVFSVSNPLPDPVLTVYNSAGAVVSTNTGWTTNPHPSTVSAAALQVGAFALPNPSLDSALLLMLQPGAYTAQITSAKGNAGIALFEAYTN